jgi:hypothetical protein
MSRLNNILANPAKIIYREILNADFDNYTISELRRVHKRLSGYYKKNELKGIRKPSLKSELVYNVEKLRVKFFKTYDKAHKLGKYALLPWPVKSKPLPKPLPKPTKAKLIRKPLPQPPKPKKEGFTSLFDDINEVGENLNEEPIQIIKQQLPEEINVPQDIDDDWVFVTPTYVKFNPTEDDYSQNIQMERFIRKYFDGQLGPMHINVEFVNSKTGVRTQQDFKYLVHLKNTIEGWLSDTDSGNDSEGRVAYKNSGISEGGSMEINLNPSGGCSKNKPTDKLKYKNIIIDLKSERHTYKYLIYNPYTTNNNCGILAVKKYIEFMSLTPNENITKNNSVIRRECSLNDGKLTLDDLDKLMSYFGVLIPDDYKGVSNKYCVSVKQGCLFALPVFIYLEKEHFKVAKLESKQTDNLSDVKKGNKRGLLTWDIESRENHNKTYKIGSTTFYMLNDIILHAYYRKYKSTVCESISFTANDTASACRQFLDWLSNQKNKYMCIAHNGANFDHYFLYAAYNKEEYEVETINLRHKSIIGLTYKDNLFRDSCCFLASKLSKLCKSFKIDKKYYKKTEINLNGKILTNEQLCFYKNELDCKDFLKLQHTEPEFWSLYNEYCLYDCISLYMIWEKFTSLVDGLVKNIGGDVASVTVNSCLTIGGHANKVFNTLNKYNKFYKQYKLFMSDNNDVEKVDREKLKYIYKFTHGGISHCEPRFAGKHTKKVCSYDICSQYPASMVNMRVPIGKSTFINYFREGRPGLYTINNLVFDTKHDFAPLATLKNGSKNWNCIKDIKPDDEFNLDSFTIDYLRYRFGLKSFKVITGLVSDKSVEGTTIFGRYVNAFFNEKSNQDKLLKNNDPAYNPVLRECIKLYLNSLSGKLVMNPEKYFSLNSLTQLTDLDILADNPDIIGKVNVNGVEMFKVETKDVNYNVLLGVMMYSYSKRLLFEYISCVGFDKIINVETDSIYFHDEHRLTFEENLKNYEQHTNRLRYGDFPISLGNELGNIKCEGTTINDSYFLGKKCYLVNKGKIGDSCRFKGLPQKTINNDGTKKQVVERSLYERMYNFKNGDTPIVCEFKTMRRELLDETRIIGGTMTRTVTPRMKYNIF